MRARVARGSDASGGDAHDMRARMRNSAERSARDGAAYNEPINRDARVAIKDDDVRRYARCLMPCERFTREN